MQILVLASRNAGKIRELTALLSGFGPITVMRLDAFPEVGDIEETGTTFAENARIKAHAVALATGHIALADDSGLAVDALNGAPGVYSARYSAEPGKPATDAGNNEKLLDALALTPDERRTARFCCAIVACAPDGDSILAEGAWEGHIAREARGTNGFGYDPLFIDPESGLHSAELSAEEKNARSHRARALAELARLWPAFWERHHQ